MPSIAQKVARTLACGTIVAVLSAPAHADGINVGVGASVGGGINAGAGASVGGRGGIDAGLGASVGGASGVNAGAIASVGGSNGIDADATASIGGSNGVDAAVDANVGDGAGTTLGLGVGDTGVGVSVGTAAALSAPSTPGASVTPRARTAVAQLSSTQLTRMKKRCAEVLSSAGTYDSDLRALCLMISRR
ncbi:MULTISPECIES: hypothetical protein [unclassified Mesorhizobium]|uniref:hypothetical protein n=1 Tax=unclassified Mesorhizobium TaxID=325217 RepID=UPI0024166747|nr:MULTISPECIES: hypothetical protein [unclassified Mesorhizobium]WFP61874.1 hypothetical protein QAZ47_25910 [Mesorhizobium sp. WSM4904]WFP75147.1 hypothetical protein QAZ22_26015 [Mesorhizobium sp. WSM4906]